MCNLFDDCANCLCQCHVASAACGNNNVIPPPNPNSKYLDVGLGVRGFCVISSRV